MSKEVRFDILLREFKLTFRIGIFHFVYSELDEMFQCLHSDRVYNHKDIDKEWGERTEERENDGFLAAIP